MGDPVTLIYTTTETVDEARAIAKVAIDAGLAACANILPGMVAVFPWQGTVQEGPEVAMILKTTAANTQALTHLVVSHHPYELPCVLHLPVSGGHPPFLAWIAAAGVPGEPSPLDGTTEGTAE